MNNKILEKCPFCKFTVAASYSGVLDGYQVDCPSCSKYIINTDAYAELCSRAITARQIANISGYLHENQGFRITTDNIDNLLKIKTPSFHERADKLLLALEEITEYAGQSFEQQFEWYSVGWCSCGIELDETITFLKNTGRIASGMRRGKRTYKIVADGWAHLEELKKVNADSQQGFVAMWFDDSMMKIYDEAISHGILNAGYNPHLVINREHNGKIDDEIIAQIRRSRFMLADFTGHRGGVYYEAGFAKGLGIEVIWTCNKEALKDLHFDIRQYNCIDWTYDDLNEFKRRIASRIEASIGHGSYQQ
ncbi:MAG: hypothetical protein Q7T53_02395 [Deltaproteobacteria bacterium]|nr:hypothetical protein [Deltaproteobacteria bacterium]